MSARPTWGESMGLPPAVCLWIEGDDNWEIDESIDLTLEEAEAVARHLLAAVEAVRAG